MKAAVVRQYGPPEAVEIAEVPRPEPGAGQVLVRVHAAGVGPWDALLREGKGVVKPALPLIPGSDISGVVESLGDGVTEFQPGDEIFGVTNEQFTGGYAEYTCAVASMIAKKPRSLGFVAAAAVPVVAVTAWQMLFEYAHAAAGQNVLIHGAGGNVGVYAVQLAKHAGLDVTATARAADVEYVRGLGARTVLDYRRTNFEEEVAPVDVVIDTVGGGVRERSLRVLSPSGVLISVASPIPKEMEQRFGARVQFFLVQVTTERLQMIGKLFDSGVLRAQVGTVLPLSQARAAHQMLAGAPHQRGKIVLKVVA